MASGLRTLREGLARHRRPMLAVFVVGSLLLALGLGVPDRPYLLVWTVVLAALVGVANPQPWARVLVDWLPVLVIAAGYDLVRDFAPDLVTRAVTEPQLRFDEILFGGTAPTVRLQRLLVDRGTPHWWDYGVWLFYLSHFVVTPTIAVWLYLRHREWFRRYALMILGVTLMAFATYFVLPAIPPWLASRQRDLQPTTRIVHAVWQSLGATGPAKVFAGDSKLANPVAALPSLHAAWPFVALLFLWTKTPRLRWVLLAYNLTMTLVLIYGAEHYLSDILLGWCYALVTVVVVTRLFDRGVERSASRDPASAS